MAVPVATGLSSGSPGWVCCSWGPDGIDTQTVPVMSSYHSILSRMLRGESKSAVATGLDDSTLFFATDNAVPVKDGEEGQGPEQLDLRITLVDAAWATRARMGGWGVLTPACRVQSEEWQVSTSTS